MSNNPCPAYPNTRCESCGERVDEGEDLFFHDGCKLCIRCAEDEDIICECGQYRNPEYDTCYECSQ